MSCTPQIVIEVIKAVLYSIKQLQMLLVVIVLEMVFIFLKPHV